MAKLAFSFDGMVVKEISLSVDRVTIGRHARCDIAINDPAVTGKHAEIMRSHAGHFIEDAVSTNGTFVNSVRIARQLLQHADVITIGQYRIVYLEELEYPACRTIEPSEWGYLARQFELAEKTGRVMSIHDRNQGCKSAAAIERIPTIVSNLPSRARSFEVGAFTLPVAQQSKKSILGKVVAAWKRNLSD